MNLGADIARTLPELRAQAESTLRATCRITRAGEPVWNPVTLQNDESPVTSYEGPCRVRAAGTQDAAADAADQALLESRYILSLPIVGSEDVRGGDVAEILTSPDDTALVGRMFTVTSVPAQSDAAVRRIPVLVTS